WSCLRVALSGSDDAAPALLGVSDAHEVLVDIVGEQPPHRHVLTAQHDDVALFRGLCPIRLKAGELLPGVGGLKVVIGEKNNEVARVDHAPVHLLDKTRCERDVVILRKNAVALLSKNPLNLLRNSSHRAATAQEEVVPFTMAAWHRGVPRAQQQWSRRTVWGSRMPVDCSSQRPRTGTSTSLQPGRAYGKPCPRHHLKN